MLNEYKSDEEPDEQPEPDQALADPLVGAVTAPIRGVPKRGFTAVLSCVFINDWYFPQTLIAETLGPIRFCLGPLTVVRRESLDAIGGFGAPASACKNFFLPVIGVD
jgi:ceramide glucosyltransferase